MLKDRTSRISRCPAIRETDVLSFGNLDETPIKILEFDARDPRDPRDRLIGRLILLFASLEKEKQAIFCLPLFIFIIYCKALRFLAILSIVWETFLKSRNAVVIWQSADEAYRVHHSTVVDKCIETQCLAFLNIFGAFVEFLT